MTAEEYENLMIDGTHVDARDQIGPTFNRGREIRVSGNYRGPSRWALVATPPRRSASVLDTLSIWILRISQWITRLS
jgi:hypothetical protein